MSQYVVWEHYRGEWCVVLGVCNPNNYSSARVSSRQRVSTEKSDMRRRGECSGVQNDRRQSYTRPTLIRTSHVREVARDQSKKKKSNFYSKVRSLYKLYFRPKTIELHSERKRARYGNLVFLSWCFSETCLWYILQVCERTTPGLGTKRLRPSRSPE